MELRQIQAHALLPRRPVATPGLSRSPDAEQRDRLLPSVGERPVQA